MKKMNTMIAVLMMSMAIGMPAMASSNPHHGRNGHHDRMGDMEMVNVRSYRGRPDAKTCFIKVGRHDSHHKIEARAERMRGVLDTYWNARTREIIVRYDARITSSYDIKRHLK